MTIARVNIYSYDIPLVRPLQLKGHTLTSRTGFLIRLEADTGQVGWGEAAPLPGFSTESTETVIAELKDLQRLLPNRELPPDPCALTGQFHQWPTSRWWSNSVHCALEMAALNLVAAEQAVPLAKLLSEVYLETVHVNGLIVDTDNVTEATRNLRRDGYRAIKLKVGNDPIEVDIARTRDAFHELGSMTTLRLDANRAWSFDGACRFARSTSDCIIEYIEEPLADTSRLREFSELTGMAVALDESVCELAPGALTNCPHVQAIVLKPTMLGGFDRTAGWARKASECNIKVVISSCFESQVGIAALTQFAAAFKTFNTPVGLDTLAWLQTSLLRDPIDFAHGRMRIVQVARAALQVDLSILKEITHS